MRYALTPSLVAALSLTLTAGIMPFTSSTAFAAVESNEVQQTAVRYSDLDLSTHADQVRLENRIRLAVSRVCETQTPGIDLARDQCRAKALRQAHRDMAMHLASRTVGLDEGVVR